MKKILFGLTLLLTTSAYAQNYNPTYYQDPNLYYSNNSISPYNNYIIEVNVFKKTKGKTVNKVLTQNLMTTANNPVSLGDENYNNGLSLTLIPLETVDGKNYLSVGYKVQDVKATQSLQIKNYQDNPVIPYPITKTEMGTELFPLDFLVTNKADWDTVSTKDLSIIDTNQYIVKVKLKKVR